MKTTFKPVLFVLLMCGVFGADEYIVKAVREGDSVTLNPDLTQIQGFIELEWQFKYKSIAYTDGRNHVYHEDELFRDRLELNQTGSLTITNMKTKHSGPYHLRIDLNTGPLNVYFPVTVYESPLVIDAVKGGMKFESVKEGYPVTLQTDVTQLYGDELIVWRCGDEGKLIAKSDMEAKSSPLYDDGRFRGRLELDQTGSLTITNTRTTDSGLYKLQISSKKQTSYKRFTVAVSEPDLSSGAVAGIVIAVLAAVVAAVAAVVIYHRRKIYEELKQTYSLQLTLDLNTVNKHLRLSENNRVISGTDTDQQYPDHPDRFDVRPQVLCRESVCGRCYWEIVWSGEDVDISVSYKSISRKGAGLECGFGCNDQSWCLICTPYGYAFLHKDRKTDLPVKPTSRRIGVYVDHRAGTLSFYSVSHTMTLIHKVHTKFTQPLYPGFWINPRSSVKLC